MRRFYFICLITVFFGQSFFSQQHHNRYNKKGERTGRWIVYNDSAKQLRAMNVKFRNGNAVGKGYYYTLEGVLARREIVRFKKIKTRFYHPGGLVRMKGQARIENLPEKAHYYFYGRWKYYDENGKLVKYGYYEKGKLVKTKYLDKNNRTNDSLINILDGLEKNFREKNLELTNSIDRNSDDPVKAEKYREMLVKRDSMTFSKVEKLLQQYGYPSRLIAGESSVVPFFIVCYATAAIREKYLKLFQSAVKTGDLSAKTLAFYIDKLQIAKGEKQVFGTQYYFDKNKNTVVYPSIDPENLEQRRAEAGF